MRPIDEKIVALRMENADFEKNAQQSMKTFADMVETFQKGIVFDADGAVAGFKTISSEANKIDFGLLNSALEKLDFRFSALGIVATQVLTNITDMVMDVGGKIARFLTVDSIAAGWKEYNTQIDSTLAIMTNTKFAHPMEEVNEVLDEMNKYSDKTIYNFTQMVQAMGTFTAGGLGLHQSKDAIIGLSNFAAAVGSTRDQYNRVMMQASAAMATGYMNLQHWRSFERAGGIGGTLLREKFLEEAIKLGKLGDSKLLAGLSEEEMLEKFRFSLKEGWLDREVMTKVFTDFANDPQMMAAATKVRTFGMMMEQIVESMGSGWARALRALVGDLEQATERWTDLTLHISERTDQIADAIGDLFTRIAEAGGTDAFFRLVKNMSSTLFNYLDVIWQSFTAVFPVFSDANIGKMVNFVNRLADSFERLSSPQSGLMKFGRFATSSFAYSLDTLGILFKEFGAILTYLIRQVFPGFESGAKSLGAGILWVMEHIQKFAHGFNQFIRKLKISDTVIDFIEDSKPVLKSFFEGFLPKMEGYATGFTTTVVGAFAYLRDNIKDVIRSISESKAGDLFRSWLAVWAAVWAAIARTFKVIFGELKIVFDALFKNLFPEASSVLEVIVAGLGWVAEKLTNVFNALAQGIEKADSGVFKTLSVIGRDIKTVFTAIAGDIGEAKQNPFTWLVDSIIWLYDQTTHNINKFNTWLEGKNLGQRIVDFFTGGFSTSNRVQIASNSMMVPGEGGIPNFIKSLLGMTTAQATGLLTGAAGTTQSGTGLFADFLKGITAPRADREPYVVVKDADKQIKDFGKTVATVIGGTVLKTFTTLTGAVANIPTLLAKGIEIMKPFGDAAKDFVGASFKAVIEVLKLILPSAEEARDSIQKVVDKVVTMSGAIWETGVYIATPALDAINNAFKSLFATIKEKGEPVKDFLTKIKDSIVNFWNALGFMGKLLLALGMVWLIIRQVNKGFTILGKSLETFGQTISGMFEPFKNILKSVSKAFYSISDMFKALQATITRVGKSIVLVNWAIALGILAASLWVIAKIPQDDLIRSGIAIGLLMASLTGAAFLLSKMEFSSGGLVLAGFASSITALVAGILILAVVPQPVFDDGISKMWQIGTFLTIAMFVLSIPKGNFQASGFAILAFGWSISILVGAMKSLSKLTTAEIEKTKGIILDMVFILGVSITMMGYFGKFSRVSQGVNMIALAAAVAGMVLVMQLILSLSKKWTQKDAERSLSLIGIIIIGLGATMWGLSNLKADGMLKVAGSLLSVVVSIAAITRILGKLAQEDFGAIFGAAISLATIIATLGLAFRSMSGVTYEPMLLGALLGVISHILIPAMIKIAEVPTGRIIGFAAAFGVLMAAIAGASYVLQSNLLLGGVTGLVTSLLAIAVTAVAISGGLLLIATAIEKFSEKTTWDGVGQAAVVIGVLTAALVAIALVMRATDFPTMMGGLALALVGLGAGLLIMVAALDALIKLEITWDAIAKLAAMLLSLAAAVAILNLAGAPALFTSIAIAMGVFVVAALAVGAAIYFLNSDIVDQIPRFMATGVAVVLALADGLILAIPALLIKAIEVAVALLEGLAKAIEDNGHLLLKASWSLTKSIVKLLEEAWNAVQPSTIIQNKIEEHGRKTGRGLSRSFGEEVDFRTPVEDDLGITVDVMGGTRGVIEDAGGLLGISANDGILSTLELPDIMDGELGKMFKVMLSGEKPTFDTGALLGVAGVEGMDSELFLSLVAEGRLNEAMDKMSSMTGSVDETVKSVVRSGVKAGKLISGEPVGENLIDGITAGAKARSDKLSRTVSSIVSHAIGRANYTLDARSPSRVMMQTGRWFTEGFAIGIERSSGMVDENVETMVETALDRVRSYATFLAQLMSEDIEMRPKISPVLNLDSFDTSTIDQLLAVGQLNGRLDFSDVNAATDRRRIEPSSENLQNANNLSIVNNIDMKDANFIIREEADIDKIAKSLDQRVVASMTKKGVKVVPV